MSARYASRRFGSPLAAEKHFGSWLSWANRSNLAPFVKLGRTLRQYREGVLAAMVLLCCTDLHLELPI